jgi:site-specific DNA-methyltransferase (adenine-specific)/modification methylase
MEGMAEYPDNYFDLAITSPPYNMNLRVMNGKYKSRQIVKELSSKYTNFNDNLSMDEYFEFLKKTINELMRVSNLVFFNIQMVTGNKPALFKILGEFHDKIKEVIIWDKTTAEPAIAEGCLNSGFEYIVVFSKNDSITRAFKEAEFTRGGLLNIWRFPKSRSVDKEHSASFPLSLPNFILSNFSKPGQRVIDPFLGTGTTAIACNAHKCNFEGFELDSEYFEKSINRIEQETAQISMF